MPSLSRSSTARFLTSRRWVSIAAGAIALSITPSSVWAEPPVTPTEVVTRTAATVSVSADGATAVYGVVDDADNATVMLTKTAGASDGEESAQSLVSIADGMRGGDTIMPVLSGDGCVVVAISQIAFDLLRDDDRNGRWDVYRLVLPACGGRENGWELVSTSNNGVATDSVTPLFPPTVSTSGSTIAYTSVEPSGYSSVHIVDLTKPITTPRTRTVPAPPADPSLPYRYRGADQPALSGDGNRLAFRSDFDPTAETPTWGTGPVRGGDAASQIYVWDLTDEAAIELISQRGGEPGQAQVRQPTISADGSTVAFVSGDPRLDPTPGWVCEPRCAEQIMVSVRSDGWQPPTVVSASPLPHPVGKEADHPVTTGNRNSWRPRLSGDGTQVAFLTRATNLTTSGALHSSHPLAGDLLVATVPRDTESDGPVVSAPPTPLDTSSPRRADHTGYSLSTSFATSVFDVGTVSGGKILDDLGGRTLVATVTPVNLTMADMNFGTVLDGLESDELFTVVRNDGPVGFIANSVEIDSDRFDVTGGSCTAGVLVPPGGTCTVYATFTPDGGESSVSVLTVAGTEGQSVTSTVAGRAGTPGLKIEPGGVNLGAVEVGDTAGPESVSIVNYSFDPITITRVSVVGGDDAVFEITSDGCSGTTISPESSCDVSIRFAPRSAGNRWTLLQVESNDGPATAASISGSSWRSGSVEAATTEGDDTLTVDGTGFAPDSPIVVSVVGQHLTYPVTTNGEGGFHLTAVPTGPGPNVTVVAAGADGTMAFHRLTITVQPTTPTYLPGYGVG